MPEGRGGRFCKAESSHIHCPRTNGDCQDGRRFLSRLRQYIHLLSPPPNSLGAAARCLRARVRPRENGMTPNAAEHAPLKSMPLKKRPPERYAQSGRHKANSWQTKLWQQHSCLSPPRARKIPAHPPPAVPRTPSLNAKADARAPEGAKDVGLVFQAREKPAPFSRLSRC